MILDEVEKWYQEADRPALYEGLTNSHNSKIISEFRSKGYKNMLK